ncbi:hypothetical protein Pcinc_034239 [Petrolisthes cinctipes]|uniref:Uncharacterized protein n=1 Tax=Petrolisthes cinctipes TaxID=88211 RepID=A0AAE1JW00_PETCI|nr:hypothetical protein Pcinc_034239 [Petrolisthes cinctipes]
MTPYGIVEVEEKKQVPSAIIKEFNINHEGELSLQYFDSSWDDWVDVDNLEQLPDKAKLQATIVLSLNEEGEKSEQINCATLSWSGMTPDMPKLQPPSSPVCLESSSHSSQHRNQWPVPFPIKESMFRRAVWDKLNKKVPLNQVERGYVLDGIYEECVRYCMYLDSFKYQLVLTSLLETFPYLQEGLPTDDAMGLWKNRLRNKFKNNRRRRDHDQPEVNAKRTKTPQGETLPSNTGPANIWNITNFLPARLPTEDDASVQRHIQLLKEQQKRLPWNRNASIIADSMLSTLSDRRSLVVKRCARLQDMQAEYPILFTENEMLCSVLLCCFFTGN